MSCECATILSVRLRAGEAPLEPPLESLDPARPVLSTPGNLPCESKRFKDLAAFIPVPLVGLFIEPFEELDCAVVRIVLFRAGNSTGGSERSRLLGLGLLEAAWRLRSDGGDRPLLEGGLGGWPREGEALDGEGDGGALGLFFTLAQIGMCRSAAVGSKRRWQ